VFDLGDVFQEHIPGTKHDLHLRGVIKNYGECCCRVRSNGKAGIFNTWSGASNSVVTVRDKFQLVRCSQSVVSYGW